MGERNNLLVVIFDVNPAWWSKQTVGDTNTGKNGFMHSLESLMVFCNSYLMLSHTNKLAFIVCHPMSCKVVYPIANSTEVPQDDSDTVKDGRYEIFVDLDQTITKELKSMMEQSNSDLDMSCKLPSLMAGALTKALCYIHNFNRGEINVRKPDSRILIVKGAEDVSTQYMPVMNCIFASQKENITIDSCALVEDSGFLQQASDITGGSYFKVENLMGLLEYLLWIFLPEVTFRDKLTLPSSSQIDYRAACFCHKQLVDVGFVCSVCLSIYCQFMPRCLTCQARFKLPSLPPTAKGKKKKKD